MWDNLAVSKSSLLDGLLNDTTINYAFKAIERVGSFTCSASTT